MEIYMHGRAQPIERIIEITMMCDIIAWETQPAKLIAEAKASQLLSLYRVLYNILQGSYTMEALLGNLLPFSSQPHLFLRQEEM